MSKQRCLAFALRLFLCCSLTFTLYCRSQVCDDHFFVQLPGWIRMDLQSRFSGIDAQLSFGSACPFYSSGELYRGESAPKYQKLWQHAYPRQIGPLISAARDGIRFNARLDSSGTSDIAILIPHAYIAIILLVMVTLEATFRARRRYAPGLCQNCGYDVRSNSDRCSECGSRIVPSALLNAKATARSRIFRIACICSVMIMALHAAAGLTTLPDGHHWPALLAAEKFTRSLMRFPLDCPPLKEFPDAVPATLFAIISLMNCLLWGWVLGSVAWLISAARTGTERILSRHYRGNGDASPPLFDFLPINDKGA